MPLYDYHCTTCDTIFEAIVPSDQDQLACRAEACLGNAMRKTPATHSFSLIQATHMKSKKNKAGFAHSHADRPKTPGKIQVGFGTTNHSS